MRPRSVLGSWDPSTECRITAIVSDARISGRSDAKVVVERLLSISGEDSLTIDRKYKEPWTGRLPTRFLVLTNELPKLTDSSGALPLERVTDEHVPLCDGPGSA